MEKHNPGSSTGWGSTWLENSFMEGDLGVLVDKQLSVSEQFVAAAKKANTRLSCINARRDKVTMPSYSVLVRPHLNIVFSFGPCYTRKMWTG